MHFYMILEDFLVLHLWPECIHILNLSGQIWYDNFVLLKKMCLYIYKFFVNVISRG